jgi:hypothetical protein
MTRSKRGYAPQNGAPLLGDFINEKPVGDQVNALSPTGSFFVPALRCERCRAQLRPELIRGSVKRIDPTIVVVKARVFCAKCLTLSPLSMRLHSRGITEVLGEGGWLTTVPKEPSKMKLKATNFLEFLSSKTLPLLKRIPVYKRSFVKVLNTPVSQVFSGPALVKRVIHR